MPTRDRPRGAAVPDLPTGLTLLVTDDHRSTATHRLALSGVRAAAGPTLWVDARNTASTYALYDLAAQRTLSGLRVARAFTAHQHLALVERLLDRTTTRTGCLVLPNLPSLYRDDDVPEGQAARMVGAAADALAGLAGSYDLRVLVTDAGPDDDLRGTVTDRVDRRYRAEWTPMGHRYTGDGVETTVYRRAGGWQTTIPYWVDLLGPAGDAGPGAAADPHDPRRVPTEG